MDPDDGRLDAFQRFDDLGERTLIAATYDAGSVLFQPKQRVFDE
jgi:hypothetical protein